jgi:hypothetical protein
VAKHDDPFLHERFFQVTTVEKSAKVVGAAQACERGAAPVCVAPATMPKTTLRPYFRTCYFGLLALSCHGGAARDASSKPETAQAVFVDDVKGDPERWFDCIDASAGVAVVTSLSCERQTPVSEFHRTCGSKARATLAPVFQQMAAQARRLRDVGSESQLECDEARPYLCRVPNLNECEPQYEVYFTEDSGPCPIRAVVTRDDFQSDEATVAATNQRLAKLLDGSGCGD